VASGQADEFLGIPVGKLLSDIPRELAEPATHLGLDRGKPIPLGSHLGIRSHHEPVRLAKEQVLLHINTSSIQPSLISWIRLRSLTPRWYSLSATTI